MSGLDRILVVPAAGRGSRLGGTVPKALVPVNGRAMLAHLADLHAPWVDAVVAVVHPSFRAEIERLAETFPIPAILAEQTAPTGMLDAILIGIEAARGRGAARLWITWCDQVGVHPDTLARLAALERGTALAFPTVMAGAPYIHFDRDDSGRIVRVRQRREGDEMPARGEGDMGVFSLSAAVAQTDLPRFATEVVPGTSTGERNFLPFIPWLARRAAVATCPATDAREAIGINTPDDLAFVSDYIRSR